MPTDDSVVSGLISKKILVYNKQLDNTIVGRGFYFSLSINEYAKNKLTYKDINVPSNFPDNLNKEDEEFLSNNRPNWINKVSHIESILNGSWNF